jgi:hypothetical protein
MAAKFKLPSKLIKKNLSFEVDYNITTVSNADKYASYHPYTFRNRSEGKMVTLYPTDDCLGRSVTINQLTGIPLGMGSVYIRDSDGEWYCKFRNHWWMASKDGQIYDSLRQWEALSDQVLKKGGDDGGDIFNVGDSVMSVDMSKDWVNYLNNTPKSLKEAYSQKNNADRFVEHCLMIGEIMDVNIIYVQNLAWEEQIGLWFPYSSEGLMKQTNFMIKDIKDQIQERFSMSLAESNF